MKRMKRSARKREIRSSEFSYVCREAECQLQAEEKGAVTVQVCIEHPEEEEFNVRVRLGSSNAFDPPLQETWHDRICPPYRDPDFPVSVTRRGKVRFGQTWSRGGGHGGYGSWKSSLRAFAVKEQQDGTLTVPDIRYWVDEDWWSKVRKIGIKV